MRIRPLYLLLALALCATTTTLAVGAAKEQPTVPLQAVEVNTLDATPPGFGDGPTPFPGPQPPKPRPTDPGAASVAEQVYAYTKGAVWFTRLHDGRLRLHEVCAVERIQRQLAAAPADRVALVEELAANHSADMKTALSPWIEVYRADVAVQEELIETQIPIEDVNAGWYDFVGQHADEIATALHVTTTAAAVECTTGRCDCCTTTDCCATGHTCSCKEWDQALEDCPRDVRVSCSTDDPPEPRRSRSPKMDWGY